MSVLHVTSNSLASLRPGPAWLRIVVYCSAAAFCVAVTLSPLASGFADRDRRGTNDLDLYRAEIDRIAAGEGYYEAAATELRTRGYPTASVFNWRMPLPIWLLGRLPEGCGKALLGVLALATLAASFLALGREAPQRIGTPVLGGLLLTGPLMLTVLGDIHVMPVVWAGVLIGLSLALWGLDRRGLALVAGLAALFVRELALPYCLLLAAAAVWQRRRGECLAWAIGLSLWAVYFAWHASNVLALIGPDDRAQPHSWLRFGGAAFVISTAQVNAYLLLLPQWVTALWMVAALVGFAGWNTSWGRLCGITAAGYTIAFAFVGQDINQYWGALTGPLWCLGAAHFPAAAKQLLQAARPSAAAEPAATLT